MRRDYVVRLVRKTTEEVIKEAYVYNAHWREVTLAELKLMKDVDEDEYHTLTREME